MTTSEPGIIRRFFGAIWRTINFSRLLVINSIFVIIMITVLSFMFADKEHIKVAKNSALVLNLVGSIVEQKTYRDPTNEYINEQMNGRQNNPEVLLSDALLVIDKATNDDRIKVLVLDLKSMSGAGLNKLQTIGRALEKFKASGKKIFAIGDYYSQNQYFLASFADQININPMGGILLDGYGYYSLYYKEALDKLKISQHIFKVGKFKSAVEPYSRNDMSAPAKEANKAWLSSLWTIYKEEVAKQRNIDINNFDENLDQFLEKLRQVEGDFGQYALNNQWVDTLASREDFRRQMIELVGENHQHNYNQVDFKDYLSVVKPPYTFDNPITDKVAVIVAKGMIQDGYKKAGTIGGDSTADLLREARLDKTVKAVVLRVDSPGGSAFASEVIRKEIDALTSSRDPSYCFNEFFSSLRWLLDQCLS